MTRPRMEPQSPGPRSNTLPTRLIGWYIKLIKSTKIWGWAEKLIWCQICCWLFFFYQWSQSTATPMKKCVNCKRTLILLYTKNVQGFLLDERRWTHKYKLIIDIYKSSIENHEIKLISIMSDKLNKSVY